MFPSFAAPTSLPLPKDQTGNQNSSFSVYHLPVTNDDQSDEFHFEDILDNYQSVIDQPSYQDSVPLNFEPHLDRSNEQDPVLHEMTTAGTRSYDQDYSCLAFAAHFRTNEQNLHFEETITAGPRSESSDKSIDISFKPRRNNFHLQSMREEVHAGLKLALRMKTNLEVVDDGYKWRKYGKKKVKSSPYPRNYFKCSTLGCNVKKRIERDRDDSSYVITTYDGVHHHEAMEFINGSHYMFSPVHVKDAVELCVVASILWPDDERSSNPILEKEVKKGIRSVSIPTIDPEFLQLISLAAVSPSHVDPHYLLIIVRHSPPASIAASRHSETLVAIRFLDLTVDIPTSGVSFCNDGMKDLLELKLRTLVPVQLSFTEDSARILRGIRIAARLGLTLSKEIKSAIFKQTSSISRLGEDNDGDKLYAIIL
ncbi:hypothetical protein L2E82_50474 [Cichorium intybus]|nr:hypothetical protein L2E82_50474 [Cichorium intybus]